MEPLFAILFLVGVVTAALNVNIAGFTPSVWLLMAFQALLAAMRTVGGCVEGTIMMEAKARIVQAVETKTY